MTQLWPGAWRAAIYGFRNGKRTLLVAAFGSWPYARRAALLAPIVALDEDGHPGSAHERARGRPQSVD
jgi:hypothetical protein